MNTALRFRSRPYVELSSGILAAGPHAGARVYFVDYVDEEGGRLGVWDGRSYDAARTAMKAWEQDGVRVVDLTAGDAA